MQLPAHELRFRQIHLDFHTSPHIPGIGEAFDVDHWVKTLKDAAVDSVTVFAVCHHGWGYYDGEKVDRHPHLKFDLLRKQFDALKANDINAPIYLTAGVNNVMAERHPEWRFMDEHGSYAGWNKSPLDPGFKMMCFNTPFLDVLCEQIEEVVTLFPNCDGIFLDIITHRPCCCAACMASMAEKGYDASLEDDRHAFADEVMLKYYQRTTASAKRHNPDMPIFHNGGHVTVGKRSILPYFSHLELESLPTGGWGYDHFPMSAKYVQTLPHDVLGMTGKFHTTWGEFGGFKHPNALKYECAAMLAFNTKCSIGDQLHPNGQLDETTYDLIGEAYRDVAAKEAWCKRVTPLADVAILSGTANQNPEFLGKFDKKKHDGDIGASRMLLEGHVQFEVIDGQDPFKDYKVIILPDTLVLEDEMVTRLKAFVDAGGKLLATGTSGLRDGQPLLDFGADFFGDSEFSPDYALPENAYRPDLIKTPFVMYCRSQRIKVTTGESFGQVFDPYFNRNFAHFCSHQHTPNQPEPSGFDLGVFSDTGLYLAHPVFTQYRGYGATMYREVVLAGLKRLLGENETFRSTLPSIARATVNEQTENSRYVVHLLFANTISRGGTFSDGEGGKATEIIEDLVPLHEVEVSLKLEHRVKAVRLEPEGTSLDVSVEEGRVVFTVPTLLCHQMVVLEWA